MTSKKVLITGASGFVGCRLATRLSLGTDYQVLALINRFSGPGVARLSRLPVELIQVDVLDLNSLMLAAKKADIIVHLAYGNRGSKNEREDITVRGTENVLKSAIQTGISKVIHMSTAAVHGLSPSGTQLDESAPFERKGSQYITSKVQAEKLMWRYHKKHGIPVVVFRPSIIYGPGGRAWTIGIIEGIKSGAILVDGAKGIANLIYIDNLIDAIICAMDKDSGNGQAFFAIDDEILTWKEVFENYASMLQDYPPLMEMSKEEIRKIIKDQEQNTISKWLFAPFWVTSDMIKNSLRSEEIRRKIYEIPWMRFAGALIPKSIKESLKGDKNIHFVSQLSIEQSKLKNLPATDMIELSCSKARFSNAKLKKLLGYNQRISLNEAFDLTEAWLQYQKLVP